MIVRRLVRSLKSKTFTTCWHTNHCRHASKYRARDILFQFYKTNNSEYLEEFIQKHSRDIDVKVPCKRYGFVYLRMNVFDTHPDDVEQARLTVVCIQGLDTTAKDGGFLQQFFDKGVRVIIPQHSSKDRIILSHRQMPLIDYSLNGKLLRLGALLEAKNIERVDLLISSQSGVWLMMKAGASWTNIHSLACIDPMGSLSYRYMYPWRPYRRMLYLAILYYIRFFVRPIVQMLHNKLHGCNSVPPYVKKKVLDIYLKTLAHSLDSPSYLADVIREKRLPLLFFYSEEPQPGFRGFHQRANCLAFGCFGIPVQNALMVGNDVEVDDEDETRVLGETKSWFAHCIIFKKGCELESMINMQTKALEELLIRVRDIDFQDLEEAVEDGEEEGEGIDVSNNVTNETEVNDTSEKAVFENQAIKDCKILEKGENVYEEIKERETVENTDWLIKERENGNLVEKSETEEKQVKDIGMKNEMDTGDENIDDKKTNKKKGKNGKNETIYDL